MESEKDTDNFFLMLVLLTLGLITAPSKPLQSGRSLGGGCVLLVCVFAFFISNSAFSFFINTAVQNVPVICASCAFRRETFDPQTSLTLPLASSVQLAIDSSVAKIENVENYMCSGVCAAKTCYRSSKFHTFPKVLRIVLNR